MTTDFLSLNLRPELMQAVIELGYTEPTPIQSSMIPLMLTGVDVIGQAQTGTGKTAAFALPILNTIQTRQRRPQALIMAPTRELAMQVANAIWEYGKHLDVQVLAIYGGSSYSRQMARLRKGVDVVVGTPGRLLDLANQGVLDLSDIKTLVLDEADEMLSMGFADDIEAILAETPAERQTALFSATLPPRIRHIADKYMRDPQSITIQRETMTVAAIEQRYYLVNEPDKTAALTRLFEIEEITSALIFARTRAGTSELASELTTRGYPAEVLNGDLSQESRERTLNRFRQNQVKVLVATDVAARGLDIDDISHVFNFDLPDDTEIYVHRIGRTGRAGKTGVAISLITPREKRMLREIEFFIKQKINRETLPTEEDIHVYRQGKLLGALKVWLGRGRYKQEREMVMKLVEEEGLDPIEIASAALKLARMEDKQRPIAPISEVSDFAQRKPEGRGNRPGSRPERRERSYGGDTRQRSPRPDFSHETGMVRLSLSLGKAHGLRPGDVVGTIAHHADIPGSTLGKIHIEDQRTLVDVPEDLVGKVLSRNGDYRFRKQVMVVERA